jgi:molybdopterin-guanine dinucleotide biosynthesis protein A
VFIVTNSPELYHFLPCPKVSDLIPEGAGSLAGIHSALFHSTTPYVFIAACDMPYLQANLIRHIVSAREEFDVVVPVSSFGPEPLHALYRKTVFDVIDTALKKGHKKIISIFDQLRVKIIQQNEIAGIDPKFESFRNINTPEEYNVLTTT